MPEGEGGQAAYGSGGRLNKNSATKVCWKCFDGLCFWKARRRKVYTFIFIACSKDRCWVWAEKTHYIREQENPLPLQWKSENGAKGCRMDWWWEIQRMLMMTVLWRRWEPKVVPHFCLIEHAIGSSSSSDSFACTRYPAYYFFSLQKSWIDMNETLSNNQNNTASIPKKFRACLVSMLLNLSQL